MHLPSIRIRRKGVVWLVPKGAPGLILAGLSIGLALSFAAGRLLGNQLYVVGTARIRRPSHSRQLDFAARCAAGGITAWLPDGKNHSRSWSALTAQPHND
jgi:hypothetical protein